jgi:hypothetical protein
VRADSEEIPYFQRLRWDRSAGRPCSSWGFDRHWDRNHSGFHDKIAFGAVLNCYDGAYCEDSLNIDHIAAGVEVPLCRHAFRAFWVIEKRLISAAAVGHNCDIGADNKIDSTFAAPCIADARNGGLKEEE